MLAFSDGGEAIIVAFVLGIPTTLGVLIGLRNGRRLGQTGNDRDIGTTVHDMAQTLEVVQTQGHENAGAIGHVTEKLDLHMRDVANERDAWERIKAVLTADLEET
jgi:hypothetical protein